MCVFVCAELIKEPLGKSAEKVNGLAPDDSFQPIAWMGVLLSFSTE